MEICDSFGRSTFFLFLVSIYLYRQKYYRCPSYLLPSFPAPLTPPPSIFPSTSLLYIIACHGLCIYACKFIVNLFLLPSEIYQFVACFNGRSPFKVHSLVSFFFKHSYDIHLMTGAIAKDHEDNDHRLKMAEE
uniref:Uncharacterized protein n=1 Tax=Pipistrellus kuhlii TaxID=59472 RepID=A0A7J7ZIT0_PIPKU|nr:hypothetical protein mPipKuh1_009412 [Pipistrellus kuhlii]